VALIHQCHRQTDRRTTCNCNTALCTVVHHAVKRNKSYTKCYIVRHALSLCHKIHESRSVLLHSISQSFYTACRPRLRSMSFSVVNLKHPTIGNNVIQRVSDWLQMTEPPMNCSGEVGDRVYNININMINNILARVCHNTLSE